VVSVKLDGLDSNETPAIISPGFLFAALVWRHLGAVAS
jgi:hypothetical protein